MESNDGSDAIDKRQATLAAQAEIDKLSAKELSKKIKQLEKAMIEHAQNLEFEQAAKVRDELQTLQNHMRGE